MGFGISQEIFKETYQRPLIVNKETQAETKSRLRGGILRQKNFQTVGQDH
jgi:hypothetical protein